MKKRRLGRNGPMVSAIGIGAMSFSDFFGPMTEEKSLAILEAALELGIDHIDTANVYGAGRSEQAIGRFLREFNAECPFTIATKAGIKRDPETGVRGFDNSAEHLEAELDASLQRLGVDRVDLFYVHRRDQDRSIEEVTDTLAGFIKGGKIASFGYSEIAPFSLRRAHSVHPVAAVQSEYSLSTRTPEIGAVQACEELGTAFVAFSPVGRGLLSDAPPTPERVAEIPFFISNPRFSTQNLTANRQYVNQFGKLAADMGTSAASLAIGWLLHQGSHIIPIPGTSSVDHLKELAAGAELALDAQDLARIETVLPIGWAHGDRYSSDQWIGPERFA